MRFKRNLLKKKAITIGAVILAVPLLFGFKADNGAENSDNNSPSNAQTSEKTVDEPFKANTDEEKVKAEDKSSNENQQVPPQRPNYNQRDSHNEEEYKKYLAQFEGRTIVKIDFEGASAETLPAVQSAALMHVGDKFSSASALRDLNAVRNTGYFYDAYQTFSEVPEGVFITYHMMENPKLQEIHIQGNTVYKEGEIAKLITLQRGEVLNSNTFNNNITSIVERYHDDGYIWMKIANLNVTEDGIVNIKISEGVLEGYKIKGNNKTRDVVILREMRQQPGEPINAKLMKRSMDRVYNLGFFEDVNIKPTPGYEPDAMIMEITVEERRTGTFGIGAGYSTSEGLVGSISVADRNFMGMGDAVSIGYDKSANEHDAHGFTFTYRRPWLDKKETAGTFRFFHRTYQYYDYDTEGDLKERYMRRYSGGEITLSRPWSEYSTNYITLRHRKDDYVRNVRSGNAGDRSGEAGKQWRDDNFGVTRSIEWQHVTDTRDNIYNPTTGDRSVLDVEIGGILGGDFSFQKASIDNQHFFKAGNHDQVWAWRGSYGWGRGDMTEFNQFRVGGQNSLRGYRDDQFRGNRMFLATLEYRFPIVKRVQGILFTDWGGAWNSRFLPKGADIYGSLGFGVALNTPFGPFRLDYGRGKQGGRFHFSMGGSF